MFVVRWNVSVSNVAKAMIGVAIVPCNCSVGILITVVDYITVLTGGAAGRRCPTN